MSKKLSYSSLDDKIRRVAVQLDDFFIDCQIKFIFFVFTVKIVINS